MNRTTAVAVLLASLGVHDAMTPASAVAQARPGVRGIVTSVNEESSLAGSETKRSGVLIGGQAWLSVGRVDLGLSYRQGSLSPSGTGTGTERDLVEGQAVVGVRVARWLRLEAGPHVRSYVTPTFTERWFLWEGQADFAAQLLAAPSVWSYLSLSRTFSANVSPAAEFDRGQAAEAGLMVRLGRSPLWAGLGYWIAQTSTAGSQRIETLQGIAGSLAVGWR